MSNTEVSQKRHDGAATEARAAARYRSEDPAEVTALPSGDVFPANFVDVSKFGLRVSAAVSMETGQKVRVRFGELIAFGVVRWCRPLRGAQFDIGIQMDHILDQKMVGNLKNASSLARRGA